ncbi:MAG: DUF1829 domain-containing protein [Planctomycetes bacterium]|nr:DUF1829 domain-containing protein [Planctomycetota bacterium]
MTTSCQELVDEYLRWLKENISAHDINGVCEITTPFLDRHNDRLQIYVRRDHDSLLLTDDAYIVSDLELSGCPLDTPRRNELLKTVLAGFGVKREGDELVVRANLHNFGQRKHSLIQAMLAVNDLFTTSKAYVRSLFLEDVTNFLDDSDVRYTPSAQFAGTSGFLHRFDFVIPQSKRAPERLVRVINQPTRDTATSGIFSWNDIQEGRPTGARMYAFLNDSEKPIPPEVVSAFKSYNILAIRWSEREAHRDELAA